MNTPRSHRVQKIFLLLAVFFVCASWVRAAEISRGDNTSTLNTTNAWIGGTVPGAGDIAVWGSALTTSKANAIGTNLTFSGIKIDTSNAGVTTNTINATTGSTLTLGADGINITAASTSLLWMRAALALGADQTWSVATNKQLTLGSATISGTNNLTISGGGTLVHAGLNLVNFGTGTLTLENIRVTSDTTARTISNNIILNGDIGAGSTAFVSGLTLAGGISLTGSGTRTISVQNSSGADTNTALTLGATNSAGTITGDGTLALVNGNPSGSVRVSLTRNGLVDTDLIIGTNVTTIMGAGTTNPFTTNSAVQVDGRMRVGSGTTTGGNFTINSLSGSGFVDSGQASGASIGTLTINGGAGTGNSEFSGVIENGSFGRVAVVKSGANTQIFSGNNTYTGDTTVSGGALIINGDQSAANGAFSVATAGTLGGSGIIGGNTGIAGTLSPGNSPGTITFANNLTMSNGSTLLFEAGDLVKVNGVLDLDSGWKLTLSASSDWQLGGSTVLFDYGTLAAFPSLNPVITDNTGLGGSLSISDLDGMIWLNGYSVVPEPSTYALLGLSGIALAAYRLRRRCRK
jgi:fibronectin-binding autotransporter adhesin